MTDTARYFQDSLGFELLPIEDEGWRFLRRDVCRVMIGECHDALHPSALGDHNYLGYFVVDDIDAWPPSSRPRTCASARPLRTGPGACVSSPSRRPTATAALLDRLRGTIPAIGDLAYDGGSVTHGTPQPSYPVRT